MNGGLVKNPCENSAAGFADERHVRSKIPCGNFLQSALLMNGGQVENIILDILLPALLMNGMSSRKFPAGIFSSPPF
jgi:hypothetical protein